MSQNSEIPEGRVNITVAVSNNGAQEHKELPLRVLVCGEFSKQQDYSASLPNRVTANSIANLMQHYKPQISLPKAIGHAQTLKFTDIKDFNPDEILKRVPKLRDLYAIRNLLKDLRTNAIDSDALKDKLAELFKDKDTCAMLAKTISTQY